MSLKKSSPELETSTYIQPSLIGSPSTTTRDMSLSNWLVQQIEVQRIDPNFTGIEILQLARILSSLSRNVHWKNVADHLQYKSTLLYTEITKQTGKDSLSSYNGYVPLIKAEFH